MWLGRRGGVLGGGDHERGRLDPRELVRQVRPLEHAAKLRIALVGLRGDHRARPLDHPRLALAEAVGEPALHARVGHGLGALLAHHGRALDPHVRRAEARRRAEEH